MSTGQQLRLAKEEIARIERFLPVMKRVLTMLRMELRAYRERVTELERRFAEMEEEWAANAGDPLAAHIRSGVTAEAVTRPQSLVGVDIDEVVKVAAHSHNDPVLVSSTGNSSALDTQAKQRVEITRTLEIEKRNLARLEDAEEEFVFLINGSEQVRLPPLYEQLSRLERALDEENGMAAAVARLLRERAESQVDTEAVELWRLFA